MRPDINLISVPSLKGLIQGYKEKGQRKEKFSVAGHRGGGGHLLQGFGLRNHSRRQRE